MMTKFSRRGGLKKLAFLGVSEMASAKMASAVDVRIDDVGSILKFGIGLPFGENSAGFCQSVWLPESILNSRIGSVSSIGGLIAKSQVTLFADTISDSQLFFFGFFRKRAEYQKRELTR